MKTRIASLAIAGVIAHGSICVAVTFTDNTSITDATYDGQDVIISGCTVTLQGPRSFASLQVLDGGVITVPRPGTTLSLSIINDALVARGGRITVDGLSTSGTGTGTTLGSPGAGSGGSYGGEGGTSATGARVGLVYGSIADALMPGSPGGPGMTNSLAAGGGSISLSVRGALRVDGLISANGANAVVARAGGGSGGGIALTIGELSGSGSISANGGTGEPGAGGGGGGGRVAITYTRNLFAGTITATGGKGYRWGGAGSIYTKAAGGLGQLLFDNGGNPATTTVLPFPPNLDLVIQNGATIVPHASFTLASLTIGQDGWLFFSNQAYSVTVSGDAIIESGGGVYADAAHAISTVGDGRTSPILVGTTTISVGGGGGHGGYGGSVAGGQLTSAGNAFDSMVNPMSPGGRGGGTYDSTAFSGGFGGGVVRLTINGMLVCNGRISADGGDGRTYYSGGGAGGSVALTVGMMAGSGTISANGGNGNSYGAYGGGGGGGGRISIQSGADFFFGPITAQGGSGMSPGGAGTIMKRLNNSNIADVLVDNGGKRGTNTLLVGASGYDLTISGGAVVNAPVEPLNSLFVTSNSWLAFSSGQTQQSLRVSKNAVIEAGGGITADGLGSLGGTSGGGAGGSAFVGTLRIGGGGGYGGYGGSGVVTGSTVRATGGSAFGSLSRPVNLGGSGGGSDNRTGGFGGGAIYLNVTGALVLSGRISANGAPASAVGAGGGAGGSVLLELGSFSGTGQIMANGGPGAGPGGGGGGGRIAITYTAGSTFEGTISAFGGAGGNAGGAGTIYIKPNTGTPGVVIDNGGTAGTNTLLSTESTTGFDLEIGNGASAWPSSTSLTVSNLFVRAGGSLTVLQPLKTNATFVVNGTAIIESNAVISVNGKGLAAGSGIGAGISANQVASGAGYGGAGGASSRARGGIAYGFAPQPVELGSGGGRGVTLPTTTSGSEGGGALRMIVRRALILDGMITANGNDALSESAGGGSGGSIWIDAGALFGSGTIQANGGAGELLDGGGGAGGRIAIYTQTNRFQGSFSVIGGQGYQPGETGTVFFGISPITLAVVSQMPTGILEQAVSSIDLQMNSLLDRSTVSPADFVLTDPDGTIVAATLTVTNGGPSTVHATFGPQTKEGVYMVRFGPQVTNLHGAGMTNTYIGDFRIVWPVVVGRVLTASNQPVAGVTLQSDAASIVATTDVQGFYSLKVPPSTSLTITPSKDGFVFVPTNRAYVSITADLQNQDFIGVPAQVSLASRVQTGDLVLNWQGIPGTAYQLLVTTNLVDWSPVGEPIPAPDAAISMQLKLPIEPGASRFYRVKELR